MRSHGDHVATSGGWHNWAGNISASPRRHATPASAADVVAEVQRAATDGLTVRMVGRGHSFTPTAVTDGVLLHPDRLTAIRSVDNAAGTVTVEAGCPLHVLNAALLARGLSLANMGDIQVQTVAGATQTGTHGTGRGRPDSRARAGPCRRPDRHLLGAGAGRRRNRTGRR